MFYRTKVTERSLKCKACKKKTLHRHVDGDADMTAVGTAIAAGLTLGLTLLVDPKKYVCQECGVSRRR